MIAIIAARTGIGFDELLRHPALLEELSDVLRESDDKADFERRARELRAGHV